MDPKVLREAVTAYNAVYDEDLREELEFKTWVNSLLEEGYDLSEFTWEEMYESYIEELTNPISDLWSNRGKIGSAAKGAYSGVMRGATRAANQLGTSTTNTAKAVKGAVTSAPAKAAASGFGSGGLLGAAAGAIGASRSQKSPNAIDTGKYAAPSAQVKTPTPAADGKVGPKPQPPTDTKPAAAPAARPAATASAKPSGPATGTLGKTSFERRTPTSSELKAAQSARASGASPEKALQAAKSAGGALSQATAAALKPAAFSPSSTSTPTPTAAPKPSLQQSIRNRRLNMDLDLFDIVKGHLLGEGYADTEEAALVIMANMSEEWRQSIVLGEAQAARENPEGHDKEEKKKYAPVRGEKTPMPPRGDKRREDFEKWYAANVR